MIDITILTATIMEIVFALIILWKAIEAMIEKKKMCMFMPFLIVGIAFCFYASFVLYGIYETVLWLCYEGMILMAIIRILTIVRRERKCNY